jgi:hypothetical protein
MKKAVVAYCLFAGLLIGCVSIEKPKPFAFPAGSIAVVGNVIYCNGKPFADLRYFEAFTRNDTMAPFSEETRGSGLVIYYYEADAEVWIHPKEGMSVYRDGVEYAKVEDMNRVWREFLRDRETLRNTVYESKPRKISWAHIKIGGKSPGKETMIRSVFYGVRISEDGRYVYYKTQGMVFDSSREYLVEQGLSR